MICTMTDSATLKTNLIVAKLQINSNVVYDERENRPLRVKNGEQQTTKVKNCWKIVVTWLFYRSCLPLTCCVISLLVPLATSQESFWWNALAHTWQEYHGNHMLFTSPPPKKKGEKVKTRSIVEWCLYTSKPLSFLSFRIIIMKKYRVVQKSFVFDAGLK